MGVCNQQVVIELMLEREMYVHTTEQPVLVSCFKWSLLVLHNAHSLHHTNIACTGPLCVMHPM